MSTPTDLPDWLAHVQAAHPQAMVLGLERVQAVLQRLPASTQPMPVVVTVAGTNGKGSSCAMLEAMFMAAGYRVGVYTSPHLVRFNERCRVHGVDMEDAPLVSALQVVEQARGVVPLTYFEHTTLAIWHALRQLALDVVILEVGLGGRLDAVNAIDPDVSLITSIDVDHAQWLGNTREAIGREKAGIMRRARVAVVGDPVPPASVRDYAVQLGADARWVGQDFGYGGDGQQWQWRGRQRRLSGLAYPALRGINQLVNAGAVLAVLEALHSQLPVPAQAVRQGLAQVALPGRFQMLAGQPAMVLDVAHNPHAAAALAQNLDAMGYFANTYAVFGAMADKDIGAMVRHLQPLVQHWLCCNLPEPRAARAAELAQSIQAAAGATAAVSCHASPPQALSHALSAAQATDRILVFGSFVTVGEVLRHGLPALAAPHAPVDVALPPRGGVLVQG
jgi:dihydrofolate synthase/folylpolyglutamate synthase